MAASRVPLDVRLAALADRWDTAPRRRPRNGHLADCPEQHEQRRRGRCAWCWAATHERGVAVVNGVPVPRTSALGGVGGRESNPDPAPRSPTPGAPRQPRHDTPTPPPELRQCPRCYGPTTNPDTHCET